MLSATLSHDDHRLRMDKCSMWVLGSGKPRGCGRQQPGGGRLRGVMRVCRRGIRRAGVGGERRAGPWRCRLRQWWVDKTQELVRRILAFHCESRSPEELAGGMDVAKPGGELGVVVRREIDPQGFAGAGSERPRRQYSADGSNDVRNQRERAGEPENAACGGNVRMWPAYRLCWAGGGCGGVCCQPHGSVTCHRMGMRCCFRKVPRCRDESAIGGLARKMESIIHRHSEALAAVQL